jgi:hypothetical protein
MSVVTARRSPSQRITALRGTISFHDIVRYI